MVNLVQCLNENASLFARSKPMGSLLELRRAPHHMRVWGTASTDVMGAGDPGTELINHGGRRR